jgi:hypothetical protein
MEARWVRNILWGLVGLLLTTGAGPATAQDLYIRNRPVRDAVIRGQERFVPLEDIERYLNASEIERLELDLESGAIRVDGEPLAETILAGEPTRLPLVAVARALGFTQKSSPEIGTIDLLSPQAVKAKERIPQTHEGGRDYQFAKVATARILAEVGRDGDPEQAARVTRIGNDLVAVSRMPSLFWHFHVLADSSPDAFTPGPGFVLVTRGLLDLGLEDDELAGILAHEIAHGTLRDHEKRLHRTENMQILEGEAGDLKEMESRLLDRIRALQTSERTLIANCRLAQQYGDSGAYFSFSSQLSACQDELNRLLSQLKKVQARRVQNAQDWRHNENQVNSPFWKNARELDADVQGMRLAVEAGFSAEGLRRGLLKVSQAGYQRFGESSLRSDLEGSATHPPLPTRLQLLEKVLQDWKNSGWSR